MQHGVVLLIFVWNSFIKLIVNERGVWLFVHNTQECLLVVGVADSFIKEMATHLLYNSRLNDNIMESQAETNDENDLYDNTHH